MNTHPKSPAMPAVLNGQLDDLAHHAGAAWMAAAMHLTHHRSVWVTGLHHPGELVPDGADVIYSLETRMQASIVFTTDTFAAHVTNDGSGTRVRIAGCSMTTADDALKRFRAELQEEEVPDELLVSFWEKGLGGGRSWTRSLIAPDWPSISSNYPKTVRSELDAVMSLTSIPAGGHVMLWTGAPGTGKTHAIRALMRNWSGWCRVHVVIDPEHFFGSAEYMTDVLRSAELRAVKARPKLLPTAGDPPSADRPVRWNLIVCEDADDFIQAGARQHVGGGMGRLLNLADGLVGQGLDIAILLTSNLAVDHIDRALLRPGRCLAAIDFAAFTPAQAGAWMGEDVLVSGKDSFTLAELFEQRGKLTQIGAREQPVTTVGMYL